MQYFEKPSSPLQRLLDRIPLVGDIVRQPLGAIGFAIVSLFVVCVVFAPLIAPYDYARQDIPNRMEGPSVKYWLGTDNLGRDLFSRLVYGSRIAFETALPSVGIALIVGMLLGLIAGYVGGWLDNLIVVVMDTLQAFPSIMLSLAILALLGPSLVNVIIVIGLTWMPNYARVVRAQTLSIREKTYVEAERSLGATDRSILLSHILPNVIAPPLILAAMDLPWVITFEAGLSFLGLGVRPPTPSWGSILSEGFDHIFETPWPILWSGLTLALTTLGFTLFGEALRDVLDPRLSGTRGL
ncbi:MAG TPA: ABC transporter permease [Anaerolineales bacterium]|nr:ABC transporter permease [Anaerolineales bacterium]